MQRSLDCKKKQKKTGRVEALNKRKKCLKFAINKIKRAHYALRIRFACVTTTH